MTRRLPQRLDRVTCEIEKITPDLAVKMLAGNEVNRNLRPRRVDLYAKQMAAGQWRLTGETIVFGPSGELLQGQHRLHACIQADAPFESVVVRGVDPESMRHMDSGLARTASDMFTLEGIKHTASTAAMTKLLIAIEGGYPLNTTRRSLITRDEMLDFWRNHVDVIEAAVQLSGPTYTVLRHSRTAWGVLAFLVIQADADLASEFFRGLATGADMAEGDPRLALRNFIVNASSVRRSISPIEIVANGIKAWNLYLDGKSVTHMKGWKPAHQFPKVAD